MGSTVSQLFSTSGQAVVDANETEKQCEKGTVVISPDAWKICPDKKGIFAEKLEGDYIKVSEHAVIQGCSDQEYEVTPPIKCIYYIR